MCGTAEYSGAGKKCRLLGRPRSEFADDFNAVAAVMSAVDCRIDVVTEQAN